MQVKKTFQKKYFYKKKNKLHFNKNDSLKNKKHSNQFNKVIYSKINRKTILKENKPKITNYLHINSSLKKGIFLKKPSFNEIIYPFSLNFKLINEYLRKK